MGKTTIKKAILEAVEQTDETILRELPLLIKWGIEADQRIGCYYQYKRDIAVLTVDQCKAPIPCGTVLVEAIMIGDHGCDCDVSFDKAIVVNKSLIDILGFSGDTITNIFYWSDGSPSFAQMYWEIQGDDIVFESNFDGEKITIRKLCYDMDKDGYPMMNDESIQAIVLYIKIKLLEREKWTYLKAQKPINNLLVAIADYRYQYTKEVRRVRGELGKPTESQRTEITDMVNDPISGHGIYTLSNLW